MPILVIHTGGTIGMVPSPLGLVTAAGVVEAAVADLAGSNRFGTTVDVLTLSPLIDSARATPKDWNRIAAAIAQGHDQYSGFVITHGTDTLAYTAAALAFALEGLARPVILTGAMHPLGTKDGDADQNLTDALHAASSAPKGVWVQFAGQLLHGTRLRKTHSDQARAFAASPSAQAPCRIAPALRVQAYSDAPNIGVLTLTPGLSEPLISSAFAACEAIVLRVFGAGTLPESPALTAALHTAASCNQPVVAISQCDAGGITLGSYAAGDLLRQTGVIDGKDMTPEAAYTKLAHAMAVTKDPSLRNSLLQTALCGEITAKP